MSDRTPRRDAPDFPDEGSERTFWEENDVVDFFDWDNSVEGNLARLKPSTTTISIRLPDALLDQLKSMANERDVPYQSMMKSFLADRVAQERDRRRRLREPLMVAETSMIREDPETKEDCLYKK
jgi:predicted DNA binding CopG/RHH family protein